MSRNDKVSPLHIKERIPSTLFRPLVWVTLIPSALIPLLPLFPENANPTLKKIKYTVLKELQL